MKKLFIIPLLIILILPFVTADLELYLTTGVTRDSSYQQDGSGVWAGRTAVEYTRAGDYRAGGVVYDVDNDGDNEIIVYDHTSNALQILTQNSSGLILEHSEDIGVCTYETNGGDPFYQTVGLLDYDNDNLTEIIATNRTHGLIYEWNTTHLTLENSQVNDISFPADSLYFDSLYPVIKCSPANSNTNNRDTCFFPFSGTGAITIAVSYDLDNNYIETSTLSSLSNSDSSRRNTHVVDYDGDGYNEFLFSMFDPANGDTYIYATELDGTSNISNSLIYTLAIGNNLPVTDIIVNNMDAVVSNGLEITLMYSDGTNWYGRTVDKTGTVLENDYCNVLTCPEGENSADNLFVCGDSTYCDFPDHDVCGYVSNDNNNDPGVNTDTIICFSLYAGAGFEETEVTQPINFTSSDPQVFYAEMTGVAGVLTSNWLIQGSTVESVDLSGEDIVIPVDYQQSGGLDIIGFSDTLLTYYDDAYTNAQVEITGYEVNPANPVCQGTSLTYTVTLSDTESDVGYCEFKEYYANNTLVEVFDNKTFTESGWVSGEQTVQGVYNPDEIASRKLVVSCTDQYNTDSAREEYSYVVNVVNSSSTCNNYGDAVAEESFESTVVDEQNDDFDDKIDDAFADIGLEGSKAKAFFWVFLMLGLAVLLGFKLAQTGMGSATPMVIAFAEIIMLVIGWVLGMIGTAIIVTLAIFCSIFLVILFLRSASSGGM